MENTSPFLAMQQVERQLRVLLRGVDTELLEPAEKKAMQSIRRLSTDVRLDIRDYELSETREEQLKCAAAARKRLLKLQASILAAGSVFGPADVAQLSANLAQIDSRLL